jgi:hypothetical protein
MHFGAPVAVPEASTRQTIVDHSRSAEDDVGYQGAMDVEKGTSHSWASGTPKTMKLAARLSILCLDTRGRVSYIFRADKD